MKPGYCRTPEFKASWSLPQALPGRRFLVAIWNWL